MSDETIPASGCGPSIGRLVLRRQDADAEMVFKAEGDIDIETVPQLREWLREIADKAPETQVTIDLRGVKFIDSAGLAVLVGAQKRLNSALHIRLMPDSQVAQVLHLTGLDRVFRCSPSA